MYMLTILQLEAYRATGDKKYLDRDAVEMVAYLDKLQQPNGLFYHAPDVPFYWGRGDGWVAVGMAEMLRDLPQDHPQRKRILESYRLMMSALLKYQGKDGMWRQLIDHDEALAREFKFCHVHLRSDHRSEKRLARRSDLWPSCA